MRKRAAIIVVGAGLAATLLAVPVSTASHIPVLRVTALSGAEENGPGTNDADGYGSAQITLRRGNLVCWRILARNIGPAMAGHIHEAATGQNGPVRVPLFTRRTSLSPSKAGCVRVSRALYTDLVRESADYYVNVHTAAFPNGAVRGQLSR